MEGLYEVGFWIAIFVKSTLSVGGNLRNGKADSELGISPVGQIGRNQPGTSKANTGIIKMLRKASPHTQCRAEADARRNASKPNLASSTTIVVLIDSITEVE